MIKKLIVDKQLANRIISYQARIKYMKTGIIEKGEHLVDLVDLHNLFQSSKVVPPRESIIPSESLKIKGPAKIIE
jgi:hypothetical protein